MESESKIVPPTLEELAALTLMNCGPYSQLQAQAYLKQLTKEEIASLANCNDGFSFKQLADAIFDRLNPPPKEEPKEPDA